MIVALEIEDVPLGELVTFELEAGPDELPVEVDTAVPTPTQ